MPRTRSVALLLVALAACAAPPTAGVGSEGATARERLGDWSPRPSRLRGLESFARVEGDRLVVETGDGPRHFVAGVNLGPTIPGHHPGEQAIRREDFRRWLPMMSSLGLRAVRVYTIMPPAFYEELRAHNLAHPEAPLYLVHGVWIPEERFHETRDLHDPVIRREFREEIERAVAVVHGDAELPDRPGHAWGTYRADVSPWLLSWAIGVEWDPEATLESDRRNRGLAPFAGRYFVASADATPTVSLLAEMLDHLASLEAARGVTQPVTFVNWPTTDPLHHPDEPLAKEDMVGVDANHVVATEAWPGGVYASYHAYPYYPDFQRYEQGIAGFELHGRRDNYAGYLTKLLEHHAGMPVVVTEVGAPSAWAHAHFGPQGRNQGGHSEQEQMAVDADLVGVAQEVGASGAFLFEWADEWFKFTWNTIDYEVPWQRRALWSNPWTNEAHFGLLAVEPGKDGPVVLVDGDGAEWEGRSQVVHESRGAVREVRVAHDEEFLYLRLVTDVPEAWEEQRIAVGFDVLPGGGGGLPSAPGVAPESDYALTIGPREEALVWVRASNDPYLIQYGAVRGYFPVDPAALEEGSGAWNVHRLIVNRPLVVPSTGEEFPVESITAGALRFGTSDPDDPAFDSRTGWSASGRVIEARLPYQAIGFSDPSSRLAYRITSTGEVETVPVERVGMVVAVGDEVEETAGYTWSPWQRAEWHERLKAGIEVLEERIVAANSLG